MSFRVRKFIVCLFIRECLCVLATDWLLANEDNRFPTVRNENRRHTLLLLSSAEWCWAPFENGTMKNSGWKMTLDSQEIEKDGGGVESKEKTHKRLATNRFVNFIVILSFWTIPFGKRWSRLWCWNGRHSVKEYDAKKCHRNHCIQILLMTFNAFIARLFDRCYEIGKIKRRHRKLFPIDSIKVFFPWIAINELLVRMFEMNRFFKLCQMSYSIWNIYLGGSLSFELFSKNQNSFDNITISKSNCLSIVTISHSSWSSNRLHVLSVSTGLARQTYNK